MPRSFLIGAYCFLNPDFAVGFDGIWPKYLAGQGLRAKRSHDKELETFYRNSNANSGLKEKRTI